MLLHILQTHIAHNHKKAMLTGLAGLIERNRTSERGLECKASSSPNMVRYEKLEFLVRLCAYCGRDSSKGASIELGSTVVGVKMINTEAGNRENCSPVDRQRPPCEAALAAEVRRGILTHVGRKLGP